MKMIAKQLGIPTKKTTLGMTLLELMTVIAIAGILAGISLYNFNKSHYSSACRGSIRTLQMLMDEARQQAQVAKLPVFLRFERLPGRGTALDGQGKLFVRWERLGCTDGNNDSWSGCPDSSCLGLTAKCAIDEAGFSPSGASATNSVCCQATGSWIEIGDTLRVVGTDGLAQLDGAQVILNNLCWNGYEGTNRISVASGSKKCTFDENQIVPIETVSLTCVDKDDARSTALADALETEATIVPDAATGLARFTFF